MLTKERIFKIHDEDCNQKYDKTLPYSFHLDCVQKQSLLFLHLVDDEFLQKTFINYSALDVCLWGHDLIEDARMTYNDIYELLLNTDSYQITIPVNQDLTSFLMERAKKITDVIYAVTDEKGKNRKERKNNKNMGVVAKEKLTAEQILERLEEIFGDDISAYAYGDYGESEKGPEYPEPYSNQGYNEWVKKVDEWVESLFGKIEEVDQYGGEGQGYKWYTIKHFVDHDVYIKTNGYYQSYNGTEFYDGFGKEVKPQQKTVTVYE